MLFTHFCVRDRMRPTAWFYFLMLFSCSLISCTGINHVLPNAVDAFDVYRRGWGYPYPGIICTFFVILSWALDVVMDRRKQTIQVAYSTHLQDEEEDLPPADPYMFTGALCAHSILEGLVLGAAPITSKSSYIYVILGVLTIHKCFEGFGLAVLYEAYEYQKWTKIMLLFAFSLLTPLGIFLGLVLLLSFSGIASLIAGIASAASAGVFLYAGISIIVSRIVPSYARSNWRFLMIFAGWAVSSTIAWFA